MIGVMLALAASAGWPSPEVRQTVHICRWALSTEDSATYERRLDYAARRLHLTKDERVNLEHGCDLFVLGQADNWLKSNHH